METYVKSLTSFVLSKLLKDRYLWIICHYQIIISDAKIPIFIASVSRKCSFVNICCLDTVIDQMVIMLQHYVSTYLTLNKSSFNCPFVLCALAKACELHANVAAYIFYKNRPSSASFDLFSFFSYNILQKKVLGITGVWTWIARRECKHADH